MSVEVVEAAELSTLVSLSTLSVLGSTKELGLDRGRQGVATRCSGLTSLDCEPSLFMSDCVEAVEKAMPLQLAVLKVFWSGKAPG
mmetsp:Transcript_32282/g.60299  ORF Transcript_32282/g.60299 Transcript_32282/m.60299 type:complete len:85 (+) Transcript_32282:791-1045(+)